MTSLEHMLHSHGIQLDVPGFVDACCCRSAPDAPISAPVAALVAPA